MDTQVLISIPEDFPEPSFRWLGPQRAEPLRYSASLPIAAASSPWPASFSPFLSPTLLSALASSLAQPEVTSLSRVSSTPRSQLPRYKDEEEEWGRGWGWGGGGG